MVTLTATAYSEPEAGGYSARVLAPPGCYTHGEAPEEVQPDLRESAAGWPGAAHEQAMARHANEELPR
jgi:predicted RNase H-like HicB family nuclease